MKKKVCGIQSFSKYLLIKHSVIVITLRAGNIRVNGIPIVLVYTGLSA